MSTTPSRTAYHEAGHAIAALQTGCDLHAVAVNGGGACKWKYYDSGAASLVIPAGAAAERHMCKGASYVRGSDRKMMRGLWRRRANGQGFSRWVTGRLMKAIRLLHGRQKCLKRLAVALEESRRLSGEDVQRIIAPTTPTDFSPEEKARLSWSDMRRADRALKSADGKALAGVEDWKSRQEERAEEYGRILREKCRQGVRGACEVL